MITRRTFIETLVGGLLAAPADGGAQPPGNVRRIGYLFSGSDTVSQRFHEAFREGLRALGWIERQKHRHLKTARALGLTDHPAADARSIG